MYTIQMEKRMVGQALLAVLLLSTHGGSQFDDITPKIYWRAFCYRCDAWQGRPQLVRNLAEFDAQRHRTRARHGPCRPIRASGTASQAMQKHAVSFAGSCQVLCDDGACRTVCEAGVVYAYSRSEAEALARVQVEARGRRDGQVIAGSVAVSVRWEW